LFASGDSETDAELVAACPRSLRLDSTCRDQLTYHLLMLEQVVEQAGRFDILHFHCDYLHYALSSRCGYAHVTTLHGRLDLPELQPIYRRFLRMPLVSISEAQRTPLSWANWQATVNHGLPPNLHTLREQPGAYLAFLGRISPEKRVDRAIHIAQRVGMPLKIAAKVDPADREYYEAEIRPLLRAAGSQVEFIGEVGGPDKDEFLGNAFAMLFPIDWPEPFGLVMIEAMACGTPVVAFSHGSVPEVMEDGVTGFVVQDVDEAVPAVERVSGLCRRKCRRVFEQRFTAARMTQDYLAVYERLLAGRRSRAPMQRQSGSLVGTAIGQNALMPFHVGDHAGQADGQATPAASAMGPEW
jgi:glycosyltransferase involved in cell wall biosynthesis